MGRSMRGFKVAGLGALAPKANKYGAKRTNGYASKAESDYATHLNLLKAAGKILDYTKQLPIHLQDDIRYVVDFMVLELDGTVRFVEVKGFRTPEFELKLKLLRQLRPELYKRLEIVSA